MYEDASFSSFKDIIIREYWEAAAAEWEEDRRIPRSYEEKSFGGTILMKYRRTPHSAQLIMHGPTQHTVSKYMVNVLQNAADDVKESGDTIILDCSIP